MKYIYAYIGWAVFFNPPPWCCVLIIWLPPLRQTVAYNLHAKKVVKDLATASMQLSQVYPTICKIFINYQWFRGYQIDSDQLDNKTYNELEKNL